MMIAVLSLLAALAGTSVSGVVKDASGAVVPGATVIVRPAGGQEQRTVTGPDGRFTVESSSSDVTVIVRAGGFAEKSEHVANAAAPIEVVLSPATLAETVTVTPTRTEQRSGSVPASVSVLTSEDIQNSPAVVADDVLRQIPTFSLFRRTSSLSSHPTSQGVSLRGIGPSGVSRTLVLVDGTPFNDPFGGWVYWTRVPLEDTDRIEVVDGSSSSLYGNYAMGGVINIVGNRAVRRTVDFKTQYGNHNSPKADVFASDVWGKVGVSVNGSVFDTDGFPIVVASERGIIDNNATVKFRNVNAKLDYSPSAGVRGFFRAGYFTEDRGNGKIGEVNDTRWTSLSGGVRAQLPDRSELQATLFGDIEKFHSTFLAVTAPSATVAARSIVRLTIDQHVPTHAFGGMVQWGKALNLQNYVSVGTDFHWVDGDSQEDSFNAAPGPVVPPTQGAILALERVSGGTQRSAGFYVQDLVTPVSNVTLTVSARVDTWRNYDPHNLETAIIPGTAVSNRPACSTSGGAPPACLQDRSDTTVSPRIAARYQATNWLSVWGDIGSGFRAPTLNELYRQFRVGTVLTTANDQLGPERLIGGEAGFNLTPVRNLTVRTTWFDNRVTNPVSNVTLTVTGANVTQQRQNLGETHIWGIQTDAEYRLGAGFKLTGGYLYNQATVTDGGAANAALVGKFLPQVPAHRVSYRVSYANPKVVNVTFGVFGIGRQFDDDQNVRVVPGQSEPGLPAYATSDLTISRNLTPNVDVFVGAQNLFNQEYIVGTLPTTIGSPRLVNGGVRIRFSGR
jgi:outer membrane receptor protein involved in Fe transport